MKKWVITLLIAAIVLGSLCFWQRNNIKALYLFITTDENEVEKIVEDNRKELEEKIKEYGDDMPRNFTPEEEAMIASGEISIEEAAELLLGETESTAEEVDGSVATEDGEDIDGKNDKADAPETKDETVKEDKADKTDKSDKKEETGKTEKTEKPGKKGDNTDKTQSGGAKTSQSEIVKKYTAKFYSLKAYYIGQLNGIEAQAKRDYAALSKEQRKSVSKVSFAAKYMNYALALEGECDGQVETLLSQMKSELEAVGGDTSIIGTIRQAYQAEKAAKKAGYMSLLG